jgi:hypothetical protein
MEYREVHLRTYNNYLSLQSEETKANIEYFKPLEDDIRKLLPRNAYKETAIKVVFKDGTWLSVYKNGDLNSIEWY